MTAAGWWWAAAERRQSGGGGSSGSGGSTAPEKPAHKTQQHFFIPAWSHTHKQTSFLDAPAAAENKLKRALTIFSPLINKIVPFFLLCCGQLRVSASVWAKMKRRTCRAELGWAEMSWALPAIRTKSSPTSRSHCLKGQTRQRPPPARVCTCASSQEMHQVLKHRAEISLNET